MKPIIINLNEISNSREVYYSKPNIFLTLFVYITLSLLTVAIMWMYFGRTDVVVKVEAILRPNNQVATVVNTFTGTLNKVNIKENSLVAEGDILYVIEHEDLLTEANYYKEQFSDTEKAIKLLNKYKKSIEDGVNNFSSADETEEYYLKYQAFELNYNQMKNDYTFSEKDRVNNLNSVTEQT